MEQYQLIVPDDLDQARLDRALASLLPDHSRSQLARMIEEALVTVDGITTLKASARLHSGQTLTLQIPDPKVLDLPSQDLPITLLYQDADIAVVDKPAGLVVHPGAGHSTQTLVNALLHHVKDLSGVGGELRPGIVHRLDKDTSGVLVIAKNDTAHRALTSQWNSERVVKEYIALVYGTPKRSSGRLEGPIGRDPKDRKRMGIVASGRAALTLFEVAERFPYASLLRCRLKTGRTHQIRVHLKFLGHPVVGDPLYSGPQWRGIPDKKIQKLLASFDRQALHAHKLTIPHPRSGEIMTFVSPVPDDLRKLLDALRGLV